NATSTATATSTSRAVVRSKAAGTAPGAARARGGAHTVGRRATTTGGGREAEAPAREGRGNIVADRAGDAESDVDTSSGSAQEGPASGPRAEPSDAANRTAGSAREALDRLAGTDASRSSAPSTGQRDQAPVEVTVGDARPSAEAATAGAARGTSS